jgi:hypothetical protein
VNVAELRSRKTGVPPLLPAFCYIKTDSILTTSGSSWCIVDQLADKPINPNDKKVYVLALGVAGAFNCDN